MNNKLYSFYVAMLRDGGYVTRCEEVYEGLFFIEYRHRHPMYGRAPRVDDQLFNGRLWLGNLDALSKYLDELHNSDGEEKYRWTDEDRVYSVLDNITKNEDAHAACTNRDLSSDSEKGIQARIKRVFKHRINTNIIQP